MNRLSLVAMLLFSQQVSADYKGDIGYTLLQIELGSGIPDGSGVVVTQVEAAIGETETDVGAWMPDVTSSQFSGKTFWISLIRFPMAFPPMQRGLADCFTATMHWLRG